MAGVRVFFHLHWGFLISLKHLLRAAVRDRTWIWCLQTLQKGTWGKLVSALSPTELQDSVWGPLGWVPTNPAPLMGSHYA